MNTISKESKNSNQLDPDFAEMKDWIEESGYSVREISGAGWFVGAPEGVRFLQLRAPNEPAYFPIDPGKYESLEDFKEYWSSLPKERRHADEFQGQTKYYHVDLKVKEEWDRLTKAADSFDELLFDTPEMFEEWQQVEEDFEDWDYKTYLGSVISAEMRVAYRRDDNGRAEDVNYVFAVKWDGDFPTLNINGIEIISTNIIAFDDEFNSRCRSVDNLHEFDAKNLSLRLLEKNHPDIILSSHEGLSGDTEVKWVLPGLVEYQGLTLTYARPKRGKTALVMSELWCGSQQGQCNVIYLAFEGHNGIGARVAAVDEHFGSCLTFAVEKARWNLSEPAGWDHVRKFVADLKTTLTAIQEAPTVVVFDTVGAALGTGSRITGAPEYFLGEAKRLQQDLGVALWLISHENDQGQLYGFKGFNFDADVVTKISRKQSSADHTHKRILGRHVESNKHLCTFRLETIRSVPVAVIQKSTAVIDKPEPNTVPNLAEAYQPLVPMLDDDGAADGLSEDELREVLNQQLDKPGMKPDTLRQQRLRAKNALIKADVLEKRDGMYFLVT